MNRALLKKSIEEAIWLWLACALVLFIFCWIHVLITSQVDVSQFSAILENLPEKLEKLSPVPFKKLISYPARVALTYEEPLLFLLMTIWCVARSSDVVSGQLGKGTMEILLAQPVSRMQVFLIPVLINIVGIAALAMLAYAGTCAGVATAEVPKPPEGSAFGIAFAELLRPRSNHLDLEMIPMSQLVRYRMFLPGVLNYFCFGVFLTGICTFFSALDRYRWRTIGVTMAIYVAHMLAELLGRAFPTFLWVRQISFFRFYEPVMFVTESIDRPELGWSWLITDTSGKFVELGPLTCNTVLMSIGIVGLISGGLWFSRRDLPAPV